MPHVTLLYPFRPREEFAALESQLHAACAEIEPFEVCLSELRHFEHGRGGHTLWLAPEPPEGLVRLQAGLVSVVPDCDDTTRHQRGFTPHLSVGQVRGRQAMSRLKRELQGNWRPISFQITEASLIWRNPPPDDVFRVDRVVSLGR